MPLSRSKKFFYSRIAIIIATVGWMLFLYAGVRGFSFWHGGFAVFFWLALGLLNYPEHSPLWLSFHRIKPFFLLYGAFVFVAILVDQFGLGARMWFYPAYQGWRMFLAYGVAYPFGWLAALESAYFFARHSGEPLAFDFKKSLHAKWYGLLDVCEQTLLFFMFMIILASIAGIAKELSVSLAAVAAILWLIVAFVRLRFNTPHSGHFAIVIAFAVAFAALSRAFPTLAMREWIYLSAPFADFFNVLLLGVPVWQWLGSFLSVLVPFRVWLVFAR